MKVVSPTILLITGKHIKHQIIIIIPFYSNEKNLYLCPRKVSTALCVHDIECTGSDCSDHGSCNGNECHCDTPWYGKKCDLIDCDITNCNGHGHCTNGKIKKVMLSPYTLTAGACVCNAGWYGSLCEKRKHVLLSFISSLTSFISLFT